MTDDPSKLDAAPVPELTLEPLTAQEAEPAAQAIVIDAEAATQPPSLEDSLSDEERAQVEAFSKQIDLSNSQQVLQYGAGAQKKMADFSETALAKVRTQELGEAGDLIANVVVELKSFDADEEKGLFGLFYRQAY